MQASVYSWRIARHSSHSGVLMFLTELSREFHHCWETALPYK
jgi:hypothetical protein